MEMIVIVAMVEEMATVEVVVKVVEEVEVVARHLMDGAMTTTEGAARRLMSLAVLAILSS